jgi:hypothetical protein
MRHPTLALATDYFVSVDYVADVAWLQRTTSYSLHLDNKSAMYQHMHGVAGFAVAMDYFYFTTDGFTSCVDNFVSFIVGFAAMAE